MKTLPFQPGRLLAERGFPMVPPTIASQPKLKNFTQSKTKANYIYELTPRGIRVKAALTVAFLERKRHEYDDLKLEIERLENEVGIGEKKPYDNSRGSA